jgi:hypothetical protein
MLVKTVYDDESVLELSGDQTDAVAINSMLNHFEYLREDLSLIEEKAFEPAGLMQDYFDIYDTLKSLEKVLGYYGHKVDVDSIDNGENDEEKA